MFGCMVKWIIGRLRLHGAHNRCVEKEVRDCTKEGTRRRKAIANVCVIIAQSSWASLMRDVVVVVVLEAPLSVMHYAQECDRRVAH